MSKNKIIVLLIATVFCTASFGQAIQSDKVPQEVLSAFKSKFPAAGDVQWAKEPNANYEAKFTMANNNQRAEFNEKGVWVETETSIPTAQVPKTVSNAVMKQSPSCKIADAEEIQTADQGKIYEVGCTKGGTKKDYRVTADGKVEKKLEKKY
ncbi:MAG: hypothetical protein JWO06_62 [Bacteroidota bacterium]|nr:hypothetical protein [Bacteroidota bacterium]